MTDDFWDNRFHWCALAAGFQAAIEGQLGNSDYVRDLAYRMFEEGAFADRVRSRRHDGTGAAGDGLRPRPKCATPRPGRGYTPLPSTPDKEAV
jgi:hypothetical protein